MSVEWTHGPRCGLPGSGLLAGARAGAGGRALDPADPARRLLRGAPLLRLLRAPRHLQGRALPAAFFAGGRRPPGAERDRRPRDVRPDAPGAGAVADAVLAAAVG